MTDTRFFTNDENFSLYDRFNNILNQTQFFDVLVGYFRASGFYKLQNAFDNIEHTRILVGLNIDKTTMLADQKAKIEVLGNSEILQQDTEENTINDIQNADDTYIVEKGIWKFVSLLKEKKIEIRAHRSRNIHAKVYIMRHPKENLDFGRVITGSSNFSEQGLVAQREFNVELKDRPDVDFALSQFETLWDEGVDVSEQYIEAITHKTGLDPDISPYNLYLKFLYEYFKDEIDADLDNVDINYPEGFLNLQYQTDAVKNAKRILDKYNGVFLADVVGLGKTFITALLLQTLEGKKLVLCPPNLVDYWHDTLVDFDVAADVQSQYQIDDKNSEKYDKYKYVIIDEVHRFRNDRTAGYGKIRDLVCKGKKVILVSATPFNNSIADIKHLINLFMDLRHSPFQGMEHLDVFFDRAEKDLKQIEKMSGRASPEYKDAINIVTSRIRENILRPLMVRRTRTEIQDIYDKDIERQGLKFPTVTPPTPLTYQFDSVLEQAFYKTIELLNQHSEDKKEAKFKYARYTPLLFLKNLDKRQATQQRNIGNFMKMLLVKRLESSSFAFKKTLSRFRESYENFIKMYNSGTIYIGRDDIFKYLDADDTQTIENWEDEGKIDKYKSSEFREEFLPTLESDLVILKELEKTWSNVLDDPKFDTLLNVLSNQCNKQKVIIFTEAKDTADYLFDKLTSNQNFPKNLVFEMSGAGGRCYQQVWSKECKVYDVDKGKKELELYFNPKQYKPGREGDIRILITTDVLAEGVNLHQSNIILNYDLPWNPTKVMQRAGRINRIGTKHDKIYTYNFFPTSTSDEHLELKDNIINKLRMFTNLLGDDNPLLEANEDVEQHHLAQVLYDSLENPTDDAEDNTMSFISKYLQILRDIRDNDPELYGIIKRMPKKVKVAVKDKQFDKNTAVTFFRRGNWTDFVISDTSSPVDSDGIMLNLIDRTTQMPVHRLSLLETIQLFECDQKTKSFPIPEDYYKLLENNKRFILSEAETGSPEGDKVKKSKNAESIIALIKALLKWKSVPLDADEQEYFKSAILHIPSMSPDPIRKLQNGLNALVTTSKSQAAKPDISAQEKQQLRIKLLYDVKQELKNYENYWRPKDLDLTSKTPSHTSEIILSKCFLGGE